MRYFIKSGTGRALVLGCLQFSSPAWQMAPRDRWIGWNHEQRQRNLQKIINNSRFLIFPWVRVKNLASSVLALAVKTVPDDWQGCYGYRPVLMETLVDQKRFKGTCYKATNWVHVGATTGRGRMDRENRRHGMAIKEIYLYPLSLSFVVTGTAWKWILNPGLGVERLVQEMGWSSFTFDWLVTSEMSIYCVVIAAVWQSTGFVMAMFLAGLRGIDDAIIKAAQVDGAGLTRIYRKIIIPSLRPVFFSTFIILTHIAIKSFDLVVVLTRGGPGYSSDLPATFMYAYAFTRGRLAMGAASAMMMFFMVMAVIVPYLYSELRRKQHA